MGMNGLFDVEISGISEASCSQALDDAFNLLDKKLPLAVKQLIASTKIIIGSGLIESGGFTNAEERIITLDAGKNALTLQAAEDFLIEAGYLNLGDWTKALPLSKDQKWSCLTYQLVHEVGHLVDGLSSGNAYKRLSTQLSPTKYGAVGTSESFAEAFAHWVFDLDILPEARQAITEILHRGPSKHTTIHN